MSTEQKMSSADKVYYYVVEDSFRTKVPKDHEDAVERTNKNGESVYEKRTKALIGEIESVSIYDQEFDDGKKTRKLNVVLDKNSEGKNPVISLPVDNRIAESILKVLPNMNPGVEYRFFIYKNDKGYAALSIKSKDEEGEWENRPEDFFWDYDKKEGKNGYPTPTEEDKSDWAFYYKKANKVMVKYVEENVLPKFQKEISQEKKDDFTYPVNETPEDFPSPF